MSLSKIYSVVLVGLDAIPIDVEVDVSKGGDKTNVVMVGLPDLVVKESKDRVMAAIKNSGYQVLGMYCTVNLAPADIKKEGVFYDLPIALGILGAHESIVIHESLKDYFVVGELGLGGETRGIYGALAFAVLAKQLNKKGILLPAANAQEAATVPGLEIIPISHLKEAIQFAQTPGSLPAIPSRLDKQMFFNQVPVIDFADIKGQAHVKRAMEIAASGGHNIIMSGPPGAGKTMMAKALLGIMPPLTMEEALECTKIHSIAGLLPEGQSLMISRPFRSPHHTVSYAGLIGGGAYPRPGEISLAHNGILFLDELPEFSRIALEVLRQPLEDRKVTISRAKGSFTFPTNIVCVAAMNPCPCGFLGSKDKVCRDTPLQIERYRGKISGPFWDRIDLQIDVPALKYQDLLKQPPGEKSVEIQKRVVEARNRQNVRFKGPRANAQMTPAEVAKYCMLDADCHEVMRQAIDLMGMSARASDRVRRVALTIADLEGKEKIQKHHLMEAIHFRNQLHAKL